MSKYQPLLDWLVKQSADTTDASFTEIERVVGFQLPRSAKIYNAYWSNANPIGAELHRIGWRARHRAHERVEFVRRALQRPSVALAKSTADAEGQTSAPDLVLLGCVKTKRPGVHAARDLYTSALFVGRRAHPESTGAPWFILSAEHGLIAPDARIESYDRSLTRMSASERQQWAQRVLDQVGQLVGTIEGLAVEIHAGAHYRHPLLLSGLKARRAAVTVPLAHLPLGGQLAWYRDHFQPAVGTTNATTRDVGHVAAPLST